MGFPGGSDGKSICLQCGKPRFDPWVWKIPWRRNWQPTPIFLRGTSHDGQRSLAGYGQWGRKESDKTERLTLLTYLFSRSVMFNIFATQWTGTQYRQTDSSLLNHQGSRKDPQALPDYFPGLR